MALAKQPELETKNKNAGYRGGLSRSLVRTLVIFTFIPLTLMAGAAFLRSRSLLRDQVINQTQGLMAAQIQQMDLVVKTKNVRLDRIIRQPNITAQIAAALKTNPQAADFTTVHSELNQELQSLNIVEGKPTFNDFVLMKTDGTVLMATKPAWEGVSLKDTLGFKNLLTGNDQSYVLYNLASLYPGQMVLATIVPYINPAGSFSATLIGFTETQDLQAELQSISNLYPSSNAYFILPAGQSKIFIGNDPYRDQLSVFLPSNTQNIGLSSTLDTLMGTGTDLPSTVEFNSSNNHPVLAQAAWSNTLHVGIAFEIQEDTIFGPLNSLIPFTIGIFLISLLAMGVVISIGTSRVFRPLAKLAEITRKFSDGDFSQRAEVSSKDEIGFLAQSFNQMAEDLDNLYRSLEQKVEERTRQIRTAAEVAQRITSTTNIDEILNRTVQLIVEQFRFYQASIFMLDRGGKVAILRGSFGPAAIEMLARGHRLEVGSRSIIGWVCANNQSRIASNVTEDPLHLNNDLLPETRSEAGIPISVGGLVLGALEVQSTQTGEFGPETIILLQIIASQIAVAIQNVELAESTQINFQELERLYRASRQIAAAHSKAEALQTTSRILIDSPYPAVVLSVEGNRLEVAGLTDANKPEILRIRTAVDDLETGWSEVEKMLSGGPVIAEATPAATLLGQRSSFVLPSPLTQFPRQLGYQSTAFLPIMNDNKVAGLITIGGIKQTLTGAMVQPYTNIADLLGTTLDKIGEAEEKERRLAEQETLATLNQTTAESLERLNRASRQIAAAHSKAEALQTTARILMDTPYTAVVLSRNGDRLEITGLTDANKPDILRIRTAVNDLESGWDEVENLLSGGPVITEATVLGLVGQRASFVLPSPLTQYPRQLGYQSAAFLPIMNSNRLVGLIIVGSTNQTLTNVMVQPYSNIAGLLGTTLDKILEAEDKERQLSEQESLAYINQAVAESTSELDKFFSELHTQIRQNIGDYAFSVALYDEATEALSIPYMYEDGRIDKIEAYPLGEGLSSILIRSGKPLLLDEDVDKRTQELGAKTVGKTARSWMGAPMIIQNKPIGAMIVQDLEHEHAFNEKNLNFFIALTNQVAAVINNARIIDESRARALQLETAAEIARDISGSLNLDELLLKAVNFIRERFNFYHSAIFLIDPQGEFAVIREATGEAGAHMKRAAHKLGVGSKSIVGYVSGRGEALIVNDTAKDATYYANPLLPNTRSEAAIPLKVGERILGILDVQSEHPFVFSNDNLRTLQILADQLAVAVVNSELFAETQEHLSQHRLLHHITTTAASGTTLEEALDSAVTGLQVTLGGDRVTIMLVDREKKLLEVKAAVGYSEDILQLRVPIGTGITGWAAAHHRSLRIDDVRQDPRYIEGSSNTNSELAVPLIYRNEVLGILNVESEKNNAYTENDEELLGTLGGSLAAIIANARLLEQIRAQADRERALYEITGKIRRSTDMQSILAITASELTKAVGARHTHIRISTSEENEEIELEESGQ